MIGNKIVLFDYYDTNSRKLFSSLKKAGFKGNAYVINETDFLPSDVSSFYQVICNRKQSGKPKFFNDIEIPDFWEIRGNNQIANVYDRQYVKANIIYSQNVSGRFVKMVEWYDDNKVIRIQDHYDAGGNLYAKTTMNKEGKPIIKAYFDEQGREIITENLITGNIVVTLDGKDYIFNDKIDFVLFALKEVEQAAGDLLINSLSTPFFVSLRWKRENVKDILFWQENVRDDIPGNMQIILNDHSQVDKIFVQQKDSYEKLIELGASKDKVLLKGYIYDFRKQNGYSKNILICTNSDQIVKIKELVSELSEYTFHIVAITEMSSTLLSLGDFKNVFLYPAATNTKIEELYKKCDIYLDINKGIEILSSLEKAFLYNQLIYAFKETLHDKNYVAAENIFEAENHIEMIKKIRIDWQDKEHTDKAIEQQKKYALSEDDKMYLEDESE